MPDGRRARTLKTREKIRRAAFALFSTKGFDATTSAQIANRAGVATGTIFVHATDKADLLFLVMQAPLAAAADERFASLPAGPLLERLLFVFEGVFAAYAESPGISAAFIGQLPSGRGMNATRMTETTFAFVYALAGLVAQAQAEGEVDPELDPTACAQNVFGLYFMALMLWISGHATLEVALSPVLRNALCLQIRGFRAK